MKRIKYLYSLLFAGLLVFNSCSDSFFDINRSPNVPSDATPDFVLPAALTSTAYVMGGWYQALGGFWSQHYAQAPSASQWATWESYNLTETDFDRQWTSLYAGSLQDYEYIRTGTLKTENWAYYSIATLMQAYTFEVLADLYDQIPFSEALQGAANLQPHYDQGQAVYEELINRVTKAISYDFNISTSVTPGSDDLIFNGNMDDWIKFGNTLKLKLMMRFVNVDPNKYKNDIIALLNENNFLDKDAMVTAYRNDQTGANPFYNTFFDRLKGNVVANTTLFAFLDENSDPRKGKLFKPSQTGSAYASVATGDYKNVTGTYQNFSLPIITATDPVYFFSQEEVLFLIAEAQQRYGSAADAENTFIQGIETSLVNLGLDADAVTYSYNGLQSIMEQKWVAATNKRAIESFFDFARTGYPNFFMTSKTSGLQGDAKPKRLFFPQSEQNRNPNTPKRVELTVPVWWAK